MPDIDLGPELPPSEPRRADDGFEAHRRHLTGRDTHVSILSQYQQHMADAKTVLLMETHSWCMFKTYIVTNKLGMPNMKKQKTLLKWASAKLGEEWGTLGQEAV